jgi:hypothetical protein
MDELRLSSNHVAFARIFNTEKKTQDVDIINNSDKPLTIDVASSAAHLSVTVTPRVLKPKQTGKISVTYDATKIQDWGYLIDRVVLKINDKAIASSPLTVSATIMEDFSKLSPEDLANSPTMEFTEKEFDFGTLKQGDKTTHEFPFKNNGKRDLIIRDVQTSCGCTAVDSKKVVKPGETSTIKVTFNSAGKTGKQNKSITIITNVPGQDTQGSDKYRIILRLKGEVN